MQYVIKLLPKDPPRFAKYWDGSDWTETIDEAHHYNDAADARDEVASIREDGMFDDATERVTIEERS